jgi:hypothetical protein
MERELQVLAEEETKMLRDRLFGQWSRIDKAEGTYVQVRESDVLVFDEATDEYDYEPMVRIDYNEVAGIRVDKGVFEILASLTYRVAEMHLRVHVKKKRVPQKEMMYVTRTPQGGIFISAKKPLGWD